jgi:hypothetical protein
LKREEAKEKKRRRKRAELNKHNEQHSETNNVYVCLPYTVYIPLNQMGYSFKEIESCFLRKLMRSLCIQKVAVP